MKSDRKRRKIPTDTPRNMPKSLRKRFKAIPPIANFLLFAKRPDPELHDLPTYALCLWASLCTGEAILISYFLYQVGKLFNVYSLPTSRDLIPLLHQSLSFYISATITLGTLAFIATMGVVFTKLSSKSGTALWERVNGQKQTNWRARSIRHKYFQCKK